MSQRDLVMSVLRATGRWRSSVSSRSAFTPDVQICQIYYHDIDGEYEPYQSGKYQNNTGIQPSLMYRDFEK